ncbi:MAG: lipid-A-disaccharide synthase [Candidatus Thiodiazotropha sp. (ex Lucinoma borealis)]|nr:lipid-A-disaccharide synthase [Candidatus Thiodiazotropha sp. (ex Lucinoma borealis)]MCU7870924.1 lipid-A-disaccharide synthase [Candidatus Thiodiazotropha sp. (ex Lucinoma borealis)]
MQNTISQGPIRIGILANEVSGDQLAAALIEALRSKQPDIRFEGMTGPLMEAAGCRSLASMDPVMGIVEVIRHLPGLLKTRRKLADHFLNSPPDLVLGVDAPDFNLALEKRFKAAGIPTAHFVSPTVWAWRQGRVKKLQQAVDLMLCIFDFEVDFLRQHKVPAVYVGHPMADQIPLEPVDARRVKTQLGLDPDRPVIALLPGSRMSEVSRLGLIFLQTALWLGQQKPGLQFVAPMVNEKIKKAFQAQLHAVAPNLSLLLLDGQSRQAISAADVVLTASGTATLETLLFKRPMVVAYRLSTVTMWLIRTFNMLKTRYVAIANLLADRPYAPEFLQEACEPEAMGRALLNFLDNRPQRGEIEQVYLAIHQRLRRNAANSAAEEILGMLDIR